MARIETLISEKDIKELTKTNNNTSPFRVSRKAGFEEALKECAYDPSLIDTEEPAADNSPFFLQQYYGRKDAKAVLKNLLIEK